MRKRDLLMIERNLRRMRQRLVENLQRIERENIRVPPRVANGDLRSAESEIADLAAEHYEREKNLELYIYEQDLLKAIDEALLRIKQGNYGHCAACSCAINSQRLLAVPNAKLCIRCQKEKERNGHNAYVVKIR